MKNELSPTRKIVKVTLSNSMRDAVIASGYREERVREGAMHQEPVATCHPQPAHSAPSTGVIVCGF